MLRSPVGRTAGWSVEVRRAALSWRTVATAALLGALLATSIDDLHRIAVLRPGALGALAYAGSRGGPPLDAMALVAGLFAAFGLVEDLSYHRGPYAWMRTGSPVAYAVMRTVGPAIGAAAAVVAAGAVGVGFAFLRYPAVAMPVPDPVALTPSGALFEAAPLVADAAWIAFAAFVTAALTLVAGVAARLRRQLVTLLVPPAFVVGGGIVARGPLVGLAPASHAGPTGGTGLALALAYWTALGAVSLAAVVRGARGRADA